MWELVSKLDLTFYRGWQSWLWGRRGTHSDLVNCLSGDSFTYCTPQILRTRFILSQAGIRGFLSWEISPRQDREWHLRFPQRKTQFSAVLPHFEVPPSLTYLTNMNSGSIHQISKENFEYVKYWYQNKWTQTNKYKNYPHFTGDETEV